jgi:ADP-ribose pyrophosphatase YjhB (NUDIX family)
MRQHQIRVKALAWIEDKDMLFVVKMHDSVKGDDYYRPIGGSVEFGERSHETVIREVREELDTAIELIASPFVVENHFVCDGVVGHEIDFLYPARFTDPALYERKTFRLMEANGVVCDALWIPIADCVRGSLRLVPEELVTWYVNRAGGKN